MTSSPSSLSGIHGGVFNFIADQVSVTRPLIVEEFHLPSRSMKTTKNRVHAWLHELARDGWIEVEDGEWSLTPKGWAEQERWRSLKGEAMTAYLDLIYDGDGSVLSNPEDEMAFQ